jgi:LmbE family N-acetylglucosaminyl deacetylase
VALSSRRPHADVWVPDGTPLDVALGRTTDLGVVAHQDDLEFLALAPVAACLDDPERWFTGVTCTDGAGSARGGRFADVADDEMRKIRVAEQRAAAEIGGYSAIVQLGHASASVRGDGHPGVVAELAEIVDATRPTNIYTHDLADKHATHVAVGVAAVEALRSLPPDRRPWRLIGVEGWRSLDWLADAEKVLLDTSGHGELAGRLAAVFARQIEGGKRYDLAEEGRRRANATLFEPRAVDTAEAVSFAMDLTPLVHNDDLDPIDFVGAAIDRFRQDVVDALRRAAPRD